MAYRVPIGYSTIPNIGYPMPLVGYPYLRLHAGGDLDTLPLVVRPDATTCPQFLAPCGWRLGWTPTRRSPARQWLFFLFTWLNKEEVRDRLPDWLRRVTTRRRAVLDLHSALLPRTPCLEFLRYDYQPIAWPFSPPHLWMIAILAGCLAAWSVIMTQGRKEVGQRR